MIGQQSLGDPTRAPAGKHTLYCYTHVPPQVEGGWAAARERFADSVEARIEELAPGFRASILGAAHHGAARPRSLEREPGRRRSRRRLERLAPPAAVPAAVPYFRYRMPVKGLYLCSSYAHPGAGVHGMCGANAALIAARDAERRGVVPS